MPISPIWEIVRLAGQLKQDGEDVLRLDIGAPPFRLPGIISASLEDALRSGATGYSAPGGISEYLHAAAVRTLQRFKGSAERCGLDARTLQPRIVGAQGGTQALMAAVCAVCNPGDNIVLPEVAWTNYVEQALLAGVESRFYQLDQHMLPIPSSLEEQLDERSRAFVINSPGNPSGAVIPPTLVRELHQLAVRRGLWLIDDLAYCDLVYEGDYLTALEVDWASPETQRCVLGIFSCSKSYSAPGLRLGYTVCPDPQLACDLAGLNDPLMGCLTTPLQLAMAQGLLYDDPATRAEVMQQRWQEALDLAGSLGLQGPRPGGGMFKLIDISASGLRSVQFAVRLLKEQQVAVVPGAAFGLHPAGMGPRGLRFEVGSEADKYVRVCFAVEPEVLRIGLQRLAAFLEQLRADRG